MPGIDSFTKLMLHMNSDFSDSSDSSHSPSASGASIDAGVKKFGAGSGLFDAGSSEYVSVSSSVDFTFGTGDWTIDFQLRRDGAQIAFAGIYTSNNNPSGSWADANDNFIISFNVNDDDRLQFRHIHSGTTTALILTDASSISDTTWHHVAFVRSGNTLMSFIDGVKQSDTVSVTGKTFGTIGNGIAIGRQDSNGSYYNGNVDEFRISKGVARWTSGFTPPTEEYDGTTPGGDTVILRRRTEGE
jgi:hypothetical protein